MKKVNNVSVQSFLKKRTVHSTALLTRSWRSFLLLFACLIGSVNALAQVEGEKIVKDGFSYIVIKTGTKFELSVYQTTKKGIVTIPDRVRISNGQELDVVKIENIDGLNPGFVGVTELTLPNTCRIMQGIDGGKDIKILHIPASVVRIDEFSVSGEYLSSLTAIEVDGGNSTYRDEDGVLMSKDKTTLYAYPAKKEVGSNGVYTVPEGVTTFLNYSFRNNSYLKQVTFPASLVSLHTDGLFLGCNNLTKIDIAAGNKAYAIEDNVIYDSKKEALVCYPIFKKDAHYDVLATCKKILRGAIVGAQLKTLNLNKVETLSTYAIKGCKQLTRLELPSTLTTMEAQAMVDLINLQEYVIEGGTNYKTHEGILYDGAGTKLLSCPPGKTIVPELLPTITSIEAGGFRNCYKITEVTIPAKVTFLGRDAFFACSKLETVNFAPNSELKTMDPYVFQHCFKLKNITLPNTLTSIGFAAFQRCESLPAKFTLPSSLQVIHANVFEKCTSLTEITIPAATQFIRAKAFVNCTNLKKVVIADRSALTSIGEAAFAGTQLAAFEFEGTAPKFQTIGKRAFADLEHLTTITFPKDLRDIQDGAFFNCQKLQHINFHEDASILSIGSGAFGDCPALTNVVLPKKLERVESSAFRNCAALKEVKLSPTIKYVDPLAFIDCPYLSSIRFIEAENAHNDNYSTFNGVLYNKDKTTLVIYPPALVRDGVLKIAPTVTTIGQFACFGNKQLTTVIVPQNVERIEARAFSRCEALTTLTLLRNEMFPVSEITSTDDRINRNILDETDEGGNVVADGKIKKVTLNVPLDLLEEYKKQDYYKKFKAIAAFASVAKDIEGGHQGNGTADYQSVDGKTATLVKVVNQPSAKTFVVPATVTMKVAGTPKEFNVTAIGAEAFKGTNYEEIVINNPHLTTLGVRAFATEEAKGAESKIKRIIFVSDAVPTTFDYLVYNLLEDDKPFEPHQKIHVKKSKVSSFKGAPNWNKYASQISYTIEGVALNNRYATFAREFDVDFNLGGSADLPGVINANKNIEVYAGNAREMKGYGDHGPTKTEYKVSFSALGVKGKNAYVAKEDGVLIKNTSSNTTEKFYYRIGEQINAKKTEQNVLYGVTLNQQEITKDVSNPAWRYYVLQEGVFRLVPNTYSKFSMNAQKAYLLLKSAAPAGAPDVLSIYEDEDITTGIDAVSADSEAPVYYNLQGVRTTTPSRGLYLRNGKKTFIH